MNPHESLLRTLISVDCEMLTHLISEVRRGKRLRKWVIVFHIVWFVLICASWNFYHFRYWQGVFQTIACMALCSLHWWAVEMRIKTVRGQKLEIARQKLEGEKLLAEFLKHKEQGFE